MQHRKLNTICAVLSILLALSGCGASGASAAAAAPAPEAASAASEVPDEPASGSSPEADADTEYRYAQITLPDGTVKSGELAGWSGISDNGQAEVTFADGSKYLASVNDIVLWSEGDASGEAGAPESTESTESTVNPEAEENAPAAEASDVNESDEAAVAQQDEAVEASGPEAAAEAACGEDIRLSLYERVGIIGDSYASGELWTENGSYLGEIYQISWIQQLARRNGFTAVNFSASGLTTRTWLDSDYGLTCLNSEPACGLYILALGINDYYSEDYGEAYLGTPEDMDTKANTFYGNYARIIEAVQAKSSAARIILLNIAIPCNSKYRDLIVEFNDAIDALGEKYGIPVADQAGDAYFCSQEYVEHMYYGHPSAVTCSAMATELERVIGICMYQNATYFETGDFLPEPDTDSSDQK